MDHIFLRPTHPYSEALLKCVPNPERLTEGPLPAITGFPPDLSRCPRVLFAARCPIGRELAQCHEEAPSRIGCSGRQVPADVECHFAEQRIAEVSDVSAAERQRRGRVETPAPEHAPAPEAPRRRSSRPSTSRRPSSSAAATGSARSHPVTVLDDISLTV